MALINGSRRVGVAAVGGRTIVVAIAAVGATMFAAPARAQSIASQVAQVGTGTVRMSFASRPDVCGNGRNGIRTRGSVNERYRDEWEDECEPGPVRVAMDVADGHVVAVRTYVGGRWRSAGNATDLGMVGVRDATDYLLGPVVHGDGKGARDAIFPATIADSVTTWPRLLTIARTDDLSRAVRTQAVFWVSQAAGDKVAEGLRDVADDVKLDREVRKQAVFAISQRRDEGVPMLIDIATTSKDPEVRRSAIFWLGQSRDARALDYFESVLKRP